MWVRIARSWAGTGSSSADIASSSVVVGAVDVVVVGWEVEEDRAESS